MTRRQPHGGRFNGNGHFFGFRWFIAKSVGSDACYLYAAPASNGGNFRKC
jgi:hypothetical protein